ncbi:peroxiredoxin family protein [Paenibacillus sp. CMAA1364]
MRKNGIAIIIVLLLVGWGVYDYLNQDQPQPNHEQQSLENIGIKKGNNAPDFELMDLKGKPVKLSDYKGKKVIINFWATWCPPCRAEMPHMEKIYEEYGDDVIVLAVNLTNTESKASDVHTFVEKFELTFPIVLDEKGYVSDTYRIIAYPTSYFVDTQGVIQEIFQGAINYDMMTKALSKIN